MPKSWPCATPHGAGTTWPAPLCTSRWSPVPTMAARPPAAMRSSRPGWARCGWPCATPIRWWQGRALRACRRRALRCTWHPTPWPMPRASSIWVFCAAWSRGCRGCGSRRLRRSMASRRWPTGIRAGSPTSRRAPTCSTGARGPVPCSPAWAPCWPMIRCSTSACRIPPASRIWWWWMARCAPRRRPGCWPCRSGRCGSTACRLRSRPRAQRGRRGARPCVRPGHRSRPGAPMRPGASIWSASCPSWRGARSMNCTSRPGPRWWGRCSMRGWPTNGWPMWRRWPWGRADRWLRCRRWPAWPMRCAGTGTR